jgi:dihydrofolate reductase
VNGAPIFVLTHKPPADHPRGPSNLTFVTDGIESAIRKRARWRMARTSSSAARLQGNRTLEAGLYDEILIHVAPYLMGGGVRLFGALPDGVRLEKLSVTDGPFATHVRYRVLTDREITDPRRSSAVTVWGA